LASPIGHSLAGATIYLWSIKPGKEQLAEFLRQRWKVISLFAILANLPDVDFILGWLMTGDPNAYHHRWTHSFVAVAGASILGAFVFKIRPGLAANWFWCFAAVGSHLLIDFFTGPELGWQRTYGMPLLWPFSDAMFQSPVSLVVGPKHHELSHLLSLHNWVWGAWEALVFGAILLVTAMNRRGPRKDSVSRNQA